MHIKISSLYDAYCVGEFLLQRRWFATWPKCM